MILTTACIESLSDAHSNKQQSRRTLCSQQWSGPEMFPGLRHSTYLFYREMCMTALKFSHKLRFLIRVDWCTILNTNSTVHKTGSFPNTIFSCLKNSLRRGSTGSSQRLICRSMADIRSSLAPLFTPRVTVRDLQEKKRKMGKESAGDG